MDIAAYLEEVRAQFESGHATEHSYRPALYKLFQSIDPAITVVNEPKRGDAGMVDFLFERDGVPFGWAEAKDIDKDVIRLKGQGPGRAGAIVRRHRPLSEGRQNPDRDRPDHARD